MTAHENRIFSLLSKNGWFEGEEPPIALARYELTEREEDILTDREIKSFRLVKDGSTRSFHIAKKARTDHYDKTHSTNGAVLIYPDCAHLWENGKLVNKIDINDFDSLRVIVRCGVVLLVTEDTVICKTVMRGKKPLAALARRAKYAHQGRHLSKEDNEVRYCIKCGRVIENGDEVYCNFCKSPKGALKRLWKYTKGSRMFIFISIVSFFAVTGVNLLSPYISALLVDEYIAPKNKYFAGFITVILAMLGVSLLSKLISIFRSRMLIRASERMIVSLRDNVFEKIQKLSVSNVARRTAGNLMHRVTRDTQQIQAMLVNQFPALIEQSLTLIGITVILILYDPIIALLIFIPVPIVFIAQRLFWNRVRIMYEMQWVAETKVETFLHDIFSGIRVVKAFGTEKRDNDNFDAYTNEECRIAMRNEKFFAIFAPIVTFALTLGEIILLYYVGMKNLSGEMSLGKIAMFTSYLSLVFGPLNWFGRIIRELSRGMRSAAKIFEIIDEKEDVRDNDNAKTPDITGNIEFKNVYFGYDESKEVLHNINLTIKPGEMIGIVGRSGVGKSTLINLVMRMYDPDDGTVLFDGVDAKDISQEHLRSKIGAVLQETFLFSGSIYDNIAYAKPNATTEEVLAASKLAGAHSFIMKLPDAYNTKVGERGYTLSGGERQRVTIARALLHDPKILILDEATSALDTETEKQIQDALAKLIDGRTTIAIAHRLSTLRNATRIIVIDKGNIAEQGTHDELMRLNGIYYGLVMAQRQMGKIKK